MTNSRQPQIADKLKFVRLKNAKRAAYGKSINAAKFHFAGPIVIIWLSVIMKQEIPFRIVVADPLAGVFMKVQKGKDAYLAPTATSSRTITFDFSLMVDLEGDIPNFLGPFSQGPKTSRFIYVNSGTYAGQGNTLWARRAKLSLMSISKEKVEAVLASTGARLETTIQGIGRDGGPVCASVKGVEWKVAGQ
ncbi:MAG: hypothetical protein HOP17_03180 [Acidobacteria bacterium]|nr:hypothetical protein [Acidobacteriota bacterium]